MKQAVKQNMVISEAELYSPFNVTLFSIIYYSAHHG